MDHREYIHQIFQRGKTQGFEDMEAYLLEKDTLQISAFEGHCEKYAAAHEKSLAIRGMYQGKMGSSYTELFSPAQIDVLIRDALDSARCKKSLEEAPIAAPFAPEPAAPSWAEASGAMTAEAKMAFVLALEKAALTADPRITGVDYCAYEEQRRSVLIKNTRGLDCQDQSGFASAFLSVVAQADRDVKVGRSFFISSHLDRFDPQKIAAAAAADAVGLLTAASIKPGNYEIILRNNVAATLLQCFAPVFCADKVQKKLSIFGGKLASRIANSAVSMIDDPRMPEGACRRLFDDEAIPSQAKYIVRNGILETYLHNRQTAAKDALPSTGNGLRLSPKTPVGIAPTNMYITEGRHRLDEMIASVNNGLLIIQLQGTHAGINPISGDFSLSSCGYLIEHGKIKRPVNQITISGNFSSLFSDIEQVGNDLLFAAPDSGYIGSPSLKIKSLAVAGG